MNYIRVKAMLKRKLITINNWIRNEEKFQVNRLRNYKLRTKQIQSEDKKNSK